jgi:hypothetical protein
MKRFKARQTYLFLVLILGVFFITGCGSGGETGHWLPGPSETIPPTVTFTVPANGATGVAINTKITATFSEAMDPATIITPTTFTVKQGATAVAGTVTYTGVTAVFTPATSLLNSSTYTATITTGATDLAGNQLAGNQAPWPAASNYVWSWTTGAAPDTTRPRVINTINANGATGVSINTKVGATFSKAMDPLTITTATFTLKQGTTAVPGAVTYSGVNAVFAPASALAANTTYTATITSMATDLAGNQLAGNQAPLPAASDYVWSWTTGAAPDTTRPTVVRTFPENLATNVALNSQVTATFSKAMDPLTITTMTFTLTAPGLVWSTTVTYLGVTAVLTPFFNLNANTTYTATVTSMATDLAGNQLAGNQAPLPAASNYVWTFTTGASVHTVSPAACAAGPLPLGSAATFGVLAGTAFTVANPTSVTGDVGSPSIIPAVGPSTLVGTKYDTASGSLPLIAAAVTDMQIAAACAIGRSCDVNYGAIDLGGLSLGPGVYCATGAINITGTLSLNAPGVYIFRTANTFNTAANAIVQFTAPATAANTSVYWVPVGATTLGANTTFIGNIMASSAAITVSAVSTVTSGSALSGSAVTVNTSTIAIP